MRDRIGDGVYVCDDEFMTVTVTWGRSGVEKLVSRILSALITRCC